MEHLLLFEAGEATYGVPIGALQEIVESPPLYFIPRAPPVYLGAANVHGAVVPVLDLQAHLGCPAARRDARIIVLAPQICVLALAVGRVGRIVPCDTRDPLPPLERRERDRFSRGSIDREGRRVELLDLSRLVSSLSP